MKLQVKKVYEKAEVGELQNNVLPLYACKEKVQIGYIEYDTGIEVKVPEGYVGFIFPSDNIITQCSMVAANSIGFVLPNQEGPIKVPLRFASLPNKKLKLGQQIGSLVIMQRPQLELEIVNGQTEENQQEEANTES